MSEENKRIYLASPHMGGLEEVLVKEAFDTNWIAPLGANVDGFEKELSEIYPWILKVARKFCCSMQDAEDLAGDTVYKLLVNRDKFDCSKPLQPWCLIIMRNTYIIRYNRNSLIHFTGLDMVDGSAISNCTAHSILFDDLVSTIQRCAKKSRCIDSVMYYASGYSYDEISEILNIPVGTVRSRISSARKFILQEISY